jgi:hypothetical protein
MMHYLFRKDKSMGRKPYSSGGIFYSADIGYSSALLITEVRIRQNSSSELRG